MKPVLLVVVAVALIAGMIVPALPARAATGSVTWTSTADFDAGTKGAPTFPGSWSSRATIPQREGDGSAVGYNGKLYVFGGASSAGPIVYLNNTQIYDTVSDSWSSGTAMPTARLGMGTAPWADRIYLMGGEVAGGASTNLTQFYNITTNAWGAGANMATPLPGGTCAVPWNGFIFVLSASSFYRYNPATNTWTTMASPVAWQNWGTCGVVGDFLYQIAMISVGAGGVKRYDFNAGTWNNAYDTPPFVPFGGPKDNPVYGGKIWLGFGDPATRVDQPFHRWFWSYEPVGKVWTRQAEASHPRDGVSANWVGGFFYSVAGRTNNSAWNAKVWNERFDPTGSTLQGTYVDTLTDNPAVSDGTFSLSARTGDTFVTPQAVANTWKWDYYDSSSEGACAETITAGGLSMSLGDASPGTDWCAKLATVGFTGDVDMRVQVSSANGRVANFHILNERCEYYGCDSTVDGFLIQLTNSPTHTLGGFIIQNSVVTACAASVGSLPDPIWMRINFTASTNVWGWWTSPDGSTWTNRGFCANTVSGTLYPILGAQWNLGSGSLTYDNFQVTAGTPTVGVYRTSGSWTSPLQAYAQQVPQQVTVDYSGATAAETISSLSIVDLSGAVIAQYATPITSGSSFTWTVPFMSALRQDWSVQVALSGDGAGSVSVLDVIVQTVSPPGGAGGRPSYAVSCVFNPLLVSWTCTDSTDYSQYAIVSVTWLYDGVIVGATAPDATITFRAPGQNWLSADANHTLQLQTYGGMQDVYAKSLWTSQWLAWAFVLVLGAIVLYAGARQITGGADRNVYFMPVDNPTYRQTAISVDEYPKGWRSYRQHDPDRYVRLRSRRSGRRWVVYGIRPATRAEQERTGRKYVAEVQTVRERM